MMRQPLTLLHVEDDDDHAEITLRALTEHHPGNAVHRVQDGEAALEYLFRRGPYAAPASSPRPQLVLLDLRLPKVDGFEVLRAIKADPELRRIPTVVLTTSAQESDVTHAYDLHANGYLVKPGDFAEYLELMSHLGFFWLVWNRSPA